MIIEDPAGDSEQVSDERIPNGVPDTDSFFPTHHDVAGPQHAQLLRDRLLEGERVL